jgi:hypothetical protein
VGGGAVCLFSYVLTINVTLVFMARYVMILRGATSLGGALEGVGPENRVESLQKPSSESLLRHTESRLRFLKLFRKPA